MPDVLAHILKGRMAGTFQEMSSDDLADAEKSGWAEPMDGRAPTVPTPGAHKASDSYFDKRAEAHDKALGVGKYNNRMMQSGGPSEKPKPKPEAPPTPIIDPAPEPETSEGEEPKRRGRPKKS